MPKLENDTSALLTLNCPGREPVQLSPGPNDVDDDFWEALLEKHGKKADKSKNMPKGFVRALLDSRSIFIIEDSDDSDDDEDEVVDDKVPGAAKDAIATVQLCENVEQLEKWAAAETRTTVLKAIDDQLTDLSETDPS